MLSIVQRRLYSKLSPKSSNKLVNKLTKKAKPSLALGPSVHPNHPTRTRFAPSPTGYLHLGSLRTALYNYLLAKNTGGQFLLRLEDTDQKRLVPDAEQNIYESLKWCGIIPDEGPIEGGPYGPYKQSSRRSIYAEYAQKLIDSGDAYYCTCSKDRLNDLRESASKLKPPTTVTYDRKCLHDSAPNIEGAIIRFKSPDVYEPFKDLLHGNVNIQPQYNNNDRRYDDIVIMKSDGLPTYHFANVIDDHLMKITHVIRGEEWLSSTPKHIALYRAFGWEPPAFIHIPLLTSLEDKKLSKRLGDIGILSMKEKGILPESIVNFVALFGWSPVRDTPGVSTSESMSLNEIVEKFSLDNLTRGNAKVNDSKLYFFNKHHLNELINDEDKLTELVEEFYPKFNEHAKGKYDKEKLKQILKLVGPSLNTLNEIFTNYAYLYETIDYSAIDTSKLPSSSRIIIEKLIDYNDPNFQDGVAKLLEDIPNISKKDIFQSVRYAIAGGSSGLTIPSVLDIIGHEEYESRLKESLKFI
ncbi:tRNA synthetases class I, catalytic domain-containing protein [Scheffersomyces coipomensis]|uniref:tRNA synthetases class I, catalytic domain-containing protein n=1 Tax=Scheffersomyces coipomensis TaxID=1788519 RepID=UPI00315CDEC6